MKEPTPTVVMKKVRPTSSSGVYSLAMGLLFAAYFDNSLLLVSVQLRRPLLQLCQLLGLRLAAATHQPGSERLELRGYRLRKQPPHH